MVLCLCVVIVKHSTLSVPTGTRLKSADHPKDTLKPLRIDYISWNRCLLILQETIMIRDPKHYLLSCIHHSKHLMENKSLLDLYAEVAGVIRIVLLCGNNQLLLHHIPAHLHLWEVLPMAMLLIQQQWVNRVVLDQ
ncbi:hypothetical protein K492DRAFT_65263 [Lichtheimia hyalospora FSU 10163]|nr:hypothetical protein K492DRAFT_65263 [Lichtheimia hyalospora FSU 10163]